jgi:hypothetical protein
MPCEQFRLPRASKLKYRHTFVFITLHPLRLKKRPLLLYLCPPLWNPYLSFHCKVIKPLQRYLLNMHKRSLKIPKGGNQKPYIEEDQTTQWPKEKVQKDKQRSTKHTYITKDRITRILRMLGQDCCFFGRLLKILKYYHYDCSIVDLFTYRV